MNTTNVVGETINTSTINTTINQYDNFFKKFGKNNNIIKIYPFQNQKAQELANQFFQKQNTILLDETRFAKFSIIPIFILLIQKIQKKQIPFLIITNVTEIDRWNFQINKWAKLESPVHFQITTPEEFMNIQSFRWGSLIFDCQSINCDISNFNFNNIIQISDGSEQPQETEFSTITVTDQDVIDSEFIEEEIRACPLTSQQKENIDDLFTSNIAKLIQCQQSPNQRQSMFLLELINQLENTSNINTKGSCKFEHILDLLVPEEIARKKIALIFPSVEFMKDFNSQVTKFRNYYYVIDNTIRPKKFTKIVNKVNSINDEHCVVTISYDDKFLGSVISQINLDTIIVTSSRFNPISVFPDILNWYRKAINPLIYRFITRNSIEEIIFNMFWDDRKISDFESMSTEDLNSILINSAVLYNRKQNSNLEIKRISYSNHMLPFKTAEVNRTNFWQDYKDAHNVQKPKKEKTKKVILPTEKKESKPKKKATSKTSVQQEKIIQDIIEDKNEKAKVIKPTKKQTTPKTSSEYLWKGRVVTSFINILHDYGCLRWDKFKDFNRPIPEIRNVAAFIISKMGGLTSNYPSIMKSFQVEITTKSYVRIDDVICRLQYHFDKFDLLTYLSDVEAITKLSELSPKKYTDIKLMNITEDDQKLLFNVYKNGLSSISQQNNYEEIKKHIKELLQVSQDLNNEKVLTLRDHIIIVQNLQYYGFTTIEEFKDHSNLLHLNTESLQNYINLIYEFCDNLTPSTRKKEISTKLISQLTIYTQKKIIKRKLFFEKIREEYKNIEKYPAEDLEFLTALAFHGFLTTKLSSVFQKTFGKDCSEAKIYSRIKCILTEDGKCERVEPNLEITYDNIKQLLPFRLDVNHMLIDIGIINNDNPNFYNDLYLYPIGYKCCCVCISPFIKNLMIWVLAEVVDNNGKPLFKVTQYRNDFKFCFQGNDPNEPFKELRNFVMKKFAAFIPPMDGHEMFGFTTPAFHQILLSMDNNVMEPKRTFRKKFEVIKSWPVIGAKEVDQKMYQKKKKENEVIKKRNDPMRPLIIDFSKLFKQNDEKKIVTMRQYQQSFSKLVERHMIWDKEDDMCLQ